MKKYLKILILLAIPVFCQSQKLGEPCNDDEEAKKMKGNWKRVEDDIVFPEKTFPRNQFKLVYTRIDSFSSLVKKSFPDLSGWEARWYRGIRGDSWLPSGPVPYALNSLYLEYYCNDNLKKFVLGDETHNWYRIFANNWGWLCQKVDDWDINMDGKMIAIFNLPPKVGKWQGTTVYAPKAHAGYSNAVVLGHNGKLPWHTLTQKQYLTGLKNWYEAHYKKGLTANPTNEKYKTSAAKLFNENIKYINSYLDTASAETLAQPTIIDPKYNSLSFKGIFGDENRGGTRVIAFSGKYFTPGLPRYVPQFIVVYWTWERNPRGLQLKEEFEKNFPLDKLRAMIDK